MSALTISPDSLLRRPGASVRRAAGAAALVLAGALLAGCGSTVPLNNKPAPVSDGASQPSSSSGSSTAVTNVQTGSEALGAQAQTLPSTIYFDFDSFVVKDEYQPVVTGWAKKLQADPKMHVRLEGNTDERGGSEYNLALGQKRADAVGKALTLLGVQPTQFEAVSFGKERPVDPGHDEAAWAKNRRVDIK